MDSPASSDAARAAQLPAYSETVRLFLSALPVACILAVTGCGSGEAEVDAPAAERVQRIDVTAGTYRGVALGDGVADLHRELGQREMAGEDEPAVPLRGDSYGPWVITYGDEMCRSTLYRYEHAVFDFSCDKLLWIETNEPGAATAEDVAVGDPLDAVEGAYPRAECGTAGGGEYEEYPACAVKIAPERFAWFGGDPIVSITIGSLPLEGVYVDEPFTGQVFELEAGEFVTYKPGVAKPGDLVVCLIEGKRIETPVPPPNNGISTDPMYVGTKPDGSVRAECGGIHAETAPPGSW
jgi:hypothetical protein